MSEFYFNNNFINQFMNFQSFAAPVSDNAVDSKKVLLGDVKFVQDQATTDKIVSWVNKFEKLISTPLDLRPVQPNEKRKSIAPEQVDEMYAAIGAKDWPEFVDVMLFQDTGVDIVTDRQALYSFATTLGQAAAEGSINLELVFRVLERLKKEALGAEDEIQAAFDMGWAQPRGYTDSELMNILAGFAQAKADGKTYQFQSWLEVSRRPFAKLFEQPSMYQMRQFSGPKATPRIDADPPKVNRHAGSQIRRGVLKEFGNTESSVRKDFQSAFGIKLEYHFPNDFLDYLAAAGEDQKAVVDALRQNSEFQKLWKWFEEFPGGNPIRYTAVPGLNVRGREVQSGFSPGYLLLIVNPTHQATKENPLDLATTIVHELIHAAIVVKESSLKQDIAIPDLPFEEGVWDIYTDMHLGPNSTRDNARKGKHYLNHRTYLEYNYGNVYPLPTPELKEKGVKTSGRHSDLNAAGHQYVSRIVSDVYERSKAGEPTSSMILTKRREHLGYLFPLEDNK